MNLYRYTYDLVRQIPPGKISTYGAVAQALGDPLASRAVGRMMNQNPDPDTMPCFKIVHSDGKLGGFGRGITDKIRRLQQENIKVKDGKIVNFDSVLFTDFTTSYPLRNLWKQQLALSDDLIVQDDFDEIKTVGGVDVAYPNNDFKQACAACVILDYQTKQVVEKKLVYRVADFPYIPTYLSFREFPFIENVVSTLNQKPSVLLVDGNGVMHPRNCGLASHTGIMLDFPTIGVAKSKLTGKIHGNRVTINNKICGYTLCSTDRVTRPLYVSTGHRVNAKTAVSVVKQLCTTKHPEPLRQAHRLAKQGLVQIRQTRT